MVSSIIKKKILAREQSQVQCTKAQSIKTRRPIEGSRSAQPVSNILSKFVIFL